MMEDWKNASLTGRAGKDGRVEEWKNGRMEWYNDII